MLETKSMNKTKGSEIFSEPLFYSNATKFFAFEWNFGKLLRCFESTG